MESNPRRDEKLEDVVDQLEADITDERSAQGLPGNAAERAQAPVEGSEEEPPD